MSCPESPVGGSKYLAVVGEAVNAEIGEQAEGVIKKCDQGRSNRTAKTAWRNGEVGDDPKGIRGGRGDQPVGQIGDFLGSQAVEKEMGNDKVILDFSFRAPVADVGNFDGDAVAVPACLFLQRTKHLPAGVDCADLDFWISAEQAGSEAAIAVAQNQGVPAPGKFSEKVSASELKKWAEAQIFEPSVGSCQMIEIGGGANWGSIGSGLRIVRGNDH